VAHVVNGKSPFGYQAVYQGIHLFIGQDLQVWTECCPVGYVVSWYVCTPLTVFDGAQSGRDFK
jgi:hypothetical protein